MKVEVKDTCKGCGRPIVWVRVMKRNAKGELEAGATCPLDPRPPVYRVANTARGVVAFRANGDVAERDAPADDEGTYMVSHFATCPKAGDFSASGNTGRMP